jgi:hypothetical protein
MKKLILIAIAFITFNLSNAQNPPDVFQDGVQTPSINFKQQYTIAERDALTVGSNDRKLIYVVDTGVNENQVWNGTAWVTLGGSGNFIPLTGTEVGNPVSGNITFKDSLKVTNVIIPGFREQIDSSVVRLTKNSINIDGETREVTYVNLPSTENPTVTVLDSFAAKHDMQGSYYNKGSIFRSEMKADAVIFFNDTITDISRQVGGLYGRETFFTRSAFNNNELEYNAGTGVFDVKADTFTFDINGSTGTNGQVLTSDGTNATWQDASVGATTLNGLTDVNITTPTDGQSLTYDSVSGDWVNGSAALNYGTRLTASITGATNLDWSTDNTVFDYTLTGATTLVDLNLPTGNDTKLLVLYTTGDFPITVPIYWDLDPDSDTYNGSIMNRIIIDCVNGNSGSEFVTYFIKNLN